MAFVKDTTKGNIALYKNLSYLAALCFQLFHVSTVRKSIHSKVTSRNLTSFPISPSYTPYNFSQEHRNTSAHMEKLDHFLCSRGHPSPCLKPVSPLATRRFTDNTSRSLSEWSRSYDILVTCYIRSTQGKLADNTHPYQTRAKRDDAS